MKYFIYIRKSTESEDRQVMSLESKLPELKEFAAKEKLEIVLSAPVQGEAGHAQTPSGLCGVNPRGLSGGGIFTPHFERSEIVAGTPAEPREFRSDIIKYTPHFNLSTPATHLQSQVQPHKTYEIAAKHVQWVVHAEVEAAESNGDHERYAHECPYPAAVP